MINAIKELEKLEESGFTTDQAKVSLNIWIELMNENLVTKVEFKEETLLIRKEMLLMRAELKHDISDLRTEMYAIRAELKGEIAALRSEMKGEIASLRSEMKELEHRMTIKMGIIMGTGITILGILQRL